MPFLRIALTLTLFTLAWAPAARALIINPAQGITHQVHVQLIQVQDDAGSNPAPLLGSASERSAIEAFIDQIWAQAGIDIVFDATATLWNSTFGLSGTPGNNAPRPSSDLSAMMIAAASAGVLSADPLALHMFYVDIVPGFSQTGSNTVNGLASIPGSRSAVWVGPNLTTFGTGREVVASVLSHEIGHNLGLPHITQAWNLLQSSGAPSQGEILNASQIATALASPFSVLVPEPGILLLLAAAFVRVGGRRSYIDLIARSSLPHDALAAASSAA